MPEWAIPVIIVGVVLVLLILFIAATYNALVVARNNYKNAFAQIDVQLKRRYDLIPNLVEAVKGYMAHERDTLEAVIQARNQPTTPSGRPSPTSCSPACSASPMRSGWRSKPPNNARLPRSSSSLALASVPSLAGGFPR
jgi:hypothetical protein